LISNNTIAAETETLSESTNPIIGILISSSEFTDQNFEMPKFSEPKITADEFLNLALSILFFEAKDVAKILNLFFF
tara:strand:- start:307 stop:534 length:228 start_codon:yes stop_codon:yes gene_type:complete